MQLPDQPAVRVVLRSIYSLMKCRSIFFSRMQLTPRFTSTLRSNGHVRQSLRQLLNYVLLVVGITVVYAVLFQVIMRNVEGQDHSWVTAFYWTMTMMSTLGLGDITFQSDLGRFFTMVVLTTGVIIALILLPFVFIRFGPWLESRVQISAPTTVPASIRNHVIIASNDDTIVPAVLQRLHQEQTPAYILEPDPYKASQAYMNGIPVVVGRTDSTQTYENVGARRARMVLVNDRDTVNTNITLTIRELAPDVPIVALAHNEDAIDVLQLSGASHVLPLKQLLGEQLANRINASHTQLHEIGSFKDLSIAELPIHRTPMVNKTIRDTRLRELTGVNIIGVWDRGRLKPARPDQILTDKTVIVVAASREQLSNLDELMMIYDVNTNPVVVIGGGNVGMSSLKALQKKDVPVHVVERKPALRPRLVTMCDKVFTGDAADYNLLTDAGILKAPSVVITTNDDAMNIYLTSYCRHLNRELRIVSRITHESNLEAIHRAGADLVLRYASLGAETILAIMEERELIMLGEDIRVFSTPTPRGLQQYTLASSDIGAQIGLIVLAIEQNGKMITNPPPSTLFSENSTLYLLGNDDQYREFLRRFDA